MIFSRSFCLILGWRKSIICMLTETSSNKTPTPLNVPGMFLRTKSINEPSLKAIFDEPTERTNWPSSQRKLNVNNEDVFGTQVEQQLQDGTVCALCVSCCKFGLVSCIFPELQNCQCSTAVGHPLPGGWIHISVCPDLPELLFLNTRFSRKNYIN